MTGESLRLAETLGALTLATDLAAGLGNESALKVCLVATATAREMSVSGASLKTVYNASLLRFLGCTAFAHETARVHSAGDDMAVLRALSLADTAKAADVLKAALRGLVPSGSPAARARTLMHFLGDREMPRKLATAHCSLASYLAGQLQMDAAVGTALDQMYERFDGKGLPRGLKGEEICLTARLIQLGFRVVAHLTLLGPQEALDIVRERAGTEIDPSIAAAFLRIGPGLLTTLSEPTVWEAFLAAEPAPRTFISGAELPRACAAFAVYADMKSPYTLGHSPAVAALARVAAERAGLPESGQSAVEVAGLLHDLGRISVPNGIWESPRQLNAHQVERMHQHSYQSERILNQSPVLAEYARLAGMHHERLDGSGYHRGLAGSQAIELPAAILAAADTYRTKLEDRPHRRALAPAAAAAHLRSLGEAGQLDRRAVEAVLDAAGQRAAVRVAGELPAGLSEREREVLVLVARGLTNKQVAERLVISSRTVQNHLASVFAKTGVSNRAGAALFAVQHGLIE
jgi:HD-GYP domain-containing protein (c-di-GMP phosphodiesterase class II)